MPWSIGREPYQPPGYSPDLTKEASNEKLLKLLESCPEELLKRALIEAIKTRSLTSGQRDIIQAAANNVVEEILAEARKRSSDQSD